MIAAGPGPAPAALFSGGDDRTRGGHDHRRAPPVDRVTRVRRVVTPGISWPLKPGQPVLIREFRTESRRTLLGLKAYADTLPGS